MKTTLQTIKSEKGQPEYVLLPIYAYKKLRQTINFVLSEKNEDYIDFNPEDFIKNPIALRRMKAKLTQADLAKQLNVSQAYISKIEQDDYKVTLATLKKISKIIVQFEKKNGN